ncbi:hypothetical protein CJF32_00007189 [Rutstroemia sp. NJR-2017a WRK4]|nr:hypothetical protein CJF32_00007189 [Rutstroemia sp. NJR-2017a WRK4]
MDITTGDLVASLTSAAAFAEKLSDVFNNHALISSFESNGVRDHVNVLSTTITPLKQVCCLLEDEVRGNGKPLLSAEGLQYVSVLVKECAAKLAKIAPVVAVARTDLRGDKKWKITSKKLKTDIVVSPAELTLDETKLLNDLDFTDWRRVSGHTRNYFQRLGEVQVRLLLVQQVIALSILSKNASAGKMDIEKIVDQHELISRTSRLAGIRQPGHCRPILRRSSLSSSNSSSSDDLSSSDDDRTSIISIPRVVTVPPYSPPPPPPPHFRPSPPCGPPPPPPPFSVPDSWIRPNQSRSDPLGPPQPSGPLPPLGSTPASGKTFPSCTPRSLQGTSMPPPNVSNMVKPPSYESHAGIGLAARKFKPSTFRANLGPACAEKNQDFKKESEDLTRKLTVKDEQPRSPEGRLFSSQHNSLGFKIKSFFRSKESLAREMKAVLENTQCVLQAFLIENQDIHPIPHSSFHSLEATHMRDILSQLNGNSWFETYSRLTPHEHDTLDAAIYQGLDPNEKAKREVIVLKLLQQNKANAWLRLLTTKLGSEHIFPHHISERVVLVILREQLVDGERKMVIPRGYIPDPADPVTLPSQTNARSTAPPGGVIGPAPPPRLPQGSRMLIAFSQDEAGVLTFVPDSQPNRPVIPGPIVYTPPPPPPPPGPPPGGIMYNAPLRPGPGPQAMETYHEFTIRLADRGSNEPRTWDRAVVTEESNAETVKLDRIEAFVRRGCGIIAAQLRLTEQQTFQVSTLMDHLRNCDTDSKFEWCWVELSLYDDAGRECWVIGGLSEWTKIHLIAMRCLKKDYRPGGVHYRPVIERMPPPPPNFGPRPNLNPYPGMPAPGPPAPPMRNIPPMSGPPMPPRPMSSARRRRSTDSESSGSDNDYSSDTSPRNSRRRRRFQERRYQSDSDSDDESDDDDDHLKINLKIRRGDDVVKKLLELWTPQSEEST